MKTLPKLSEYVLKETKSFFENRDYEPSDLAFNLQRTIKFITQPLNISHFVPAIEKDGKWIVLEEPKAEKYSGNSNNWVADFRESEKEYQTALDNVVFKCKVCVFSEEHIRIDFTNEISLHWYKGSLDSYKGRDLKTIEDLAFLNLEVNENIIKKFGL